MPVWNPEPVVTINAVSFTSLSLWNVNLSYGRTTVWEQARSGFATIDILNSTNTDYGFDMNQPVTIKVKNSVGTLVTLFTGKISNVSNRIADLGASGTNVIQSISVVSTFASMARKVVGNVAYPIELDDARMTRIFTEAGVTVDIVDTPGIYTFEARPANPDDGYSLAASYASQAFGYIYETASGSVGFANESRRRNYVATYNYFNVPKSNILFNGLQSQKTLSNIMNNIILSYKAAAQKTSSDAASIVTYGSVGGSVITELELAADAQIQADRYVTLRALPRTSLSSFTIQLDSSLVSSANLDKFLAVSMDTALQIDSLPLPIKNATYKGFVEGYTFSINRFQTSLTMDTSDFTYSVAPTRWQDVSAALIWNAVAATLTWATYDD